jgi:hypothetical protein
VALAPQMVVAAVAAVAAAAVAVGAMYPHSVEWWRLLPPRTQTLPQQLPARPSHQAGQRLGG